MHSGPDGKSDLCVLAVFSSCDARRAQRLQVAVTLGSKRARVARLPFLELRVQRPGFEQKSGGSGPTHTCPERTAGGTRPFFSEMFAMPMLLRL